MIFSKKNKDELIYRKSLINNCKIIFTLFYFHELCLDNSLFLESINQIKTRKNNIENEFQKLIKIYDEKLLANKNMIKELEEEINKIIGEKNNLSKDKILEIMKNNDIPERIDRLMKKLNKEISRMKIIFDKYCVNQILELFNELKSFDLIIEKISLNFKASSYKSSISATVGGIIGTIFGYFVDDLALVAASSQASYTSLAFTSIFSITSGIIIACFGIGFFVFKLYQNNKENKKKINDFYNEIIKNAEDLNKKYKQLLNDKKEKFKNELKKLKLNKNDIKYLKRNKFPEIMKSII